MKKQKYTKLMLPREVFRYTDAEKRITDEQDTFTPVTKLEWNKGIFLHLEGAEYPQKGMPSPEVLWALGHAKKLLLGSMKILSRWFFIPGLVLVAFLPWKRKVKIMEEFLLAYVHVAWKAISPYMLKDEYLTPIAREIEWGVYTFLNNIGIRPSVSTQISEIISSFIEYDSAYRYRFEDIFSETSKVKLTENLSKEVKRLSRLLASRDQKDVAKRIGFVTGLLRILILHPKIKKALKIAIQEIDIRKMGYDEADRYWVCFRHDYEFMGMTYKERKDMIKDKKQPRLVPINKATK